MPILNAFDLDRGADLQAAEVALKHADVVVRMAEKLAPAQHHGDDRREPEARENKGSDRGGTSRLATAGRCSVFVCPRGPHSNLRGYQGIVISSCVVGLSQIHSYPFRHRSLTYPKIFAISLISTGPMSDALAVEQASTKEEEDHARCFPGASATADDRLGICPRSAAMSTTSAHKTVTQS